MGRPFAEEIEELENTHKWACEVSVDDLSDSIARMLSRPQLSVGSGGSFTTATVASSLFRDASIHPSFAMTPLTMSSMKNSLRNSSVFIATAGGSNHDVIGAFRTAARSDSRGVLALCARTGTKLATEAAKFSNASVQEFSVPSNGDGFLATNSLWASSVLLVRAFSKASGSKTLIPKNLARLVGRTSWTNFVNEIATCAEPLWSRETVVVLYGQSSHAAAVDLESKLSEAALSNVWIADYRHFAHGRHHWFAKRGDRSSIVAFIEPKEAELARRTLKALPAEIPRLQIVLPDHSSSLLYALAHVFPIVMAAGTARSIDPGRPGVPAFGREIYHLNAFGKMSKRDSDIEGIETAAIERKSGLSLSQVINRRVLDDWRKSYEDYLHSLDAVRFHAVVFDYDGTLCDASERFAGVRAEIADELKRLLAHDIAIGVATGRGRSVRESLRSTIPKKFWKQVLVGYYNGGQVSHLSDDECPDGTVGVIDSFEKVFNDLVGNSRLLVLAKVEGRRKQITISPKPNVEVEECWQLANHLVHASGHSGVQFVRSSHSFDVLPADVTKLSVVEQLQSRNLATQVLSIGDMGCWPGNDYLLLSHSYSLSVDQVSPDRLSCWNLASPGVAGVQATLEYLGRFECGSRGTARLRMRRLERKKHRES